MKSKWGNSHSALQEKLPQPDIQKDFIKVIFDAKYGEWLGTHMIGYNVTEIIIETVVGS